MTATVYLRPTGFVDAPFGFDGKVARLAGGLLWFGQVELIRPDESGRQTSELVSLEALEPRLAALPPAEAEEAQAAWANILKPRAPLQLGERTIRLDEPQVMGILNVTPDSFADGDRF